MQTNLWVPGKEHNMIGEAKFDPELIDHVSPAPRGRRSCGRNFSLATSSIHLRSPTRIYAPIIRER